MAQWIILDRDGVINQDSDDYIKSVDEWIPIAGSLEAISRLKKAGYKIAVATNQSGLARGYFTLQTLDAMHQKMQNLLAQRGAAIDEVVFCPHGPNDNCNCRKPKPGLLMQIAQRHQLNLADTYFVGDTMSDITAAKTAGAKAALVKTGKGQRTLDAHDLPDDVPVFESLSHFTRELLSHG